VQEDSNQFLAIPCLLGWAGCRQSIALVLFSTSQRSSICFQAANNGIYFLCIVVALHFVKFATPQQCFGLAIKCSARVFF
jgi:hypothetical protein